MANIRSINEIILNLIDYYRLAQPDADSKPGTIFRDLFIEGPASQLALLYESLAGIADKQSFRLVLGNDLDKLAKNFGIVRKSATPATGVALLTFSSINSAIDINKGDTIISNNGFSYTVTVGTSVLPSASNFYKSLATKYKDQLEFVGISDPYAVEVTVISSSPGSAANIGVYALSRTTIPGVSNVTNINPFIGGTDQETDANFRNRILAAFSGSSVGTSLGYLNTALGTSGVVDANVIEPGDVLMTRDGSQVKTNADGSKTILSEGSGGKVDIVVFGSNLIENADSYIYKDKSNNDATNSKNDVVLGQISGDENKTINKKRVDNIAANKLPAQPVDSIIQVSGSISGSNFISKSIDSLGRITGNYELIKDTGVYAGSPWGFDKIHWISNKISLFEEDRIKGQPNGQDSTTFTDVLEIPKVQQSLAIVNENSLVTTDRSIIKLLHTPINNVTRVFNVNTGERYIITNQNYDNTEGFNTTGRIQISGNTLPTPSDTLQVDYNWIVNFDPNSDYDGLKNTLNSREVSDSIDWGYANIVKNEKVSFELSAGNNYFIGTTTHPISSVISANKYVEIIGTVFKINSGAFINKLAVDIGRLSVQTDEVTSVTFKHNNSELYITAQNNGTFENSTEVVGIDILYSTRIVFPTDSSVKEGDIVSVKLNSTDVYTSDSDTGNSNGTQITIPATLVDTTASKIDLDVTYIADVNELFSSTVPSLPSSRQGNGYVTANNNGFQNKSITNSSRREHQVVKQNLSLQFYLDLSLSSVDSNLSPSDVLSVIRLSDGLELWNSDNLGTIDVSTNNTYQIILSGVNSPALNDRVLIIYYANDILRFQPFSFQNELINSRIESLNVTSGQLFVPINNLTDDTINFSIIEPNTDISLYTITDGYMEDGYVSSLTQNFVTLYSILNKQVKITNAGNPNNNGLYDIVGYDVLNNKIEISNLVNNLSTDQISVIRILDGKELDISSIDVANNQILLSGNAAANDKVYVLYYRYKNLRKASTRVIGTISDQVNNPGLLTVAGHTIHKAEDIIFTAINTGLKQNLSEALRKAISLNSTTAIPSNIKLVKLIKLEKVIVSGNSEDILDIYTVYDTLGTKLLNSLYFSNEMEYDKSLTSLDFTLPNTLNNTLNTDTQNLIKIGDKLKVSFYYVIENDYENLSYTRNGSLYTNKKFAFINKFYVSSGFSASQSTKFTASSFTQPSLGARYKVFYDYTAPKQNERILITYNYNKLISDVTFNIENTRPINADVLVKNAKEILVDLTMNVVISDSYKNSTATVLQNLRDQLVNALTTDKLGDIIDTVDLINIAQSVQGISRARILYFNKNGAVGQVLKLQGQKDEYFSPNNVIINTEVR